MKKIASALFFGILCPVLLFGQGETSNWYFGNGAGVRFNNNGTVAPLKKGKLSTFEGCATISDTFGNLLFYTDGLTVYNSNHEIMENGEGLYGDPSSTQSALIVPKPEDPLIFYIFTVDTKTFEADPDYGLNYSVVDISLNKGLGAITEKNINLLPNCSEKITAVVKECFDQSIWIITLASANGNDGILTTYHAFEVNPAGVVNNAVKSTLPDLRVADPRGYLKLSSDGKKLVSANVTDGLYIYDFDDSNGRVTNQQEIVITDENTNPYGVEFSPNSRFLYVHTSNNLLGTGGHSSSLLQYDLSASDIDASMVVLDNRPIFRGALQQASNGKIYRTIAKNYNEGTSYLGVINNPNEVGDAADYKHNAVFLEGKKATQGLPPFIQSFFGNTALVTDENGAGISTLNLCVGDPFTLEVEAFPDATYTWEKDGLPLNVAGDNIYDIPVSNEGDSGRYRLEITFDDPAKCPIIGESQIRVLPVPDAIVNLAQCDIDAIDTTDGITRINLELLNEDPDLQFTFYNSIADRIIDQPITGTDQFENTQPFNQTIYYKAINSLGCTNEGEIQLEVSPVDIVSSALGPVYSCDEIPEDAVLRSTFNLDDIAESYGDIEVDFYASLTDMSLEQNLLTGSINSESTTLFARLASDNQCLGVEEISLVVNPTPFTEMQASYLLCTDSPGLAIEGPVGFDSYRWIKVDGSAENVIAGGQSTLISSVGNYILETRYNYYIGDKKYACDNSVAFSVLPSNMAVFQEVQIKDFSNRNTVQVVVSGEGSYSYSLDGITYQQNNLFDDVAPGSWTIYVKDDNGCGISEREIAVMGYPKFFTPNGDGVNDFWQLDGVENLLATDAYISIYDRYGTFVTQINPKDQGWNGDANAQMLPASDYWFKINLKDGRQFKGHFALKR
ncbi:T9SS type B sorting domain-containing protein [Muriicola sp. Z0-33]|uniref:T9SS type B sorting domain-containing protein n=1 Tax=Muriicola sp. Z0-33 TaxID=2816957 RepID=UPI0022389A20|nr:T9SS type B sorting domain-containing protein [Muriicola sp. Z0-33]MCW5515969.1 T9SS type B sorting domain-containing protein [Muriicola sp. Z0-33]